MKINKVIIWGHTLHDHTHSYIHNAFFRTFKYMDYEVYWFSTEGIDNYDSDNILDFNNTLFIVHGIVCSNLPINSTSIYIMHNVELIGDDLKIPNNHIFNKKNIDTEVETDKIIGIPKENIITLQVFTYKCKDYGKEVLPYHYIMEPPNSSLFMPWATDILPHEISDNIDNLRTNKYNLISNFIGMPLEHNVKLNDSLKKYNIKYKNYGGTFNIKSDNNKSIEENMALIQESIIAPALQSEWQIENGYIPCRIFKNISYGKMGITNNLEVQNLFQDKLIYSDDINTLVNKSLIFSSSNKYYSVVEELMIEVKEKHTYINRINFILDYLDKYFQITLLTKK